jgi:hypothetical protein
LWSQNQSISEILLKVYVFEMIGEKPIIKLWFFKGKNKVMTNILLNLTISNSERRINNRG